MLRQRGCREVASPPHVSCRRMPRAHEGADAKDLHWHQRRSFGYPDQYIRDRGNLGHLTGNLEIGSRIQGLQRGLFWLERHITRYYRVPLSPPYHSVKRPCGVWSAASGRPSSSEPPSSPPRCYAEPPSDRSRYPLFSRARRPRSSYRRPCASPASSARFHSGP